jgi:hypothetical protein
MAADIDTIRRDMLRFIKRMWYFMLACVVAFWALMPRLGAYICVWLTWWWAVWPPLFIYGMPWLKRRMEFVAWREDIERGGSFL